MNRKLLRGCCYNSILLYRLQNFFKLRGEYVDRFRIASGYLKDVSSVVDLCAGDGALKNFLPKSMQYAAVEPSAAFSNLLDSRKLHVFKISLTSNTGFPYADFDAAVMIISLCHFSKKTISTLLERFKQVRKKVVIVEELVCRKRKKKAFFQRAMDYLCSTDYCKGYDMLTPDEFKQLIEGSGYAFIRHSKRYAIGYYEKN